MTGVRENDRREVDLHHSRVCVEARKLAVGDHMTHDKTALTNAPEPFSALQIRQLGPLSDGQAKYLGGVRRLG